MNNSTKTALRLAIIFILIVCAGILLLKITKPAQLTVSEIIISGNSRVDSEEIIKRAGFIVGVTSMFFLESDSIQKIKENKWIENVIITKEYPGKVIINIEENDPFCILKTNDEIHYYMNKEGKKLGTLDVKQGLDFPIIFSDGIINSDLIDQAIKILNLSKSSSVLNWKEISEITVNPESGIKLITVDRRLIEFGSGNITNKWYKVEKIITHARTKNLSEDYINISSESLGVVNFNI